MRKLFTFLLTMVLAISAFAVDVAYVVGEEFKSVASLEGKSFAIVNLTDAKAVYGSNMQNMAYGAYADAFKSSNSGFTFKLVSLATDADESVRGYYLLDLLTPAGKEYTFQAWGGTQLGYFNSQPADKACCFLLGLNNQNGQDLKNGAVWDVQYEEGKGFSLKNIGTGKYFKGPNAPANSDEPVYYSFVPVEYDLATNAKAAEAVKTPAEKQALADAKTAYEANKESEEAVNNYVAAIDAAIASINNCDAVKASFAGYKLSTLGTAAAKEVETKYNAGEYKDATELSAAYVAAVKAQNCDGADMTGAIINPSFELGNTSGWTVTNSNDTGAKENSNGTYTMKGCDGKYLFNIWSSGNAISQAIEGLPNGTYKLQAVIATDADHKVQLNGNDKNAQIAAVDKGTGVEGEVEFEVTDGKATIGAEGVDKYWYKVDNFRLTLVKAADAVVPEKDAWYTGADFFRFRADKNATADSPYAAYKDKVEPAWGAAAGEETNGCIVCKVPANVNPASQIWIRGTEAGQTIANGSTDGFKVTFRVKADGEYTLESQAHNNWGYKTGGNPFGPLNVTTEWQTVSFVCTGAKAKADFTDLCFNLSGDAERTFYFDDVQIVRGSEWYLNNEFHAKDYKNGNETYSDDMNKPHPAARFVSDAEGGYVEVISNAKADQTYNSQIWIAIPEKYVGGSTKMTMEVQASKAITLPESFQATATGCGWGCDSKALKGLALPAGEWTKVERVLNTKDIKSNTWNSAWNGWQADQYCLDLSEKDATNGEAITYKFRNLKFEEAEEAWTSTMAYRLKVTPFTYDAESDTWTKGSDTNDAPAYDFGEGGEEGGYFKVTAAAKQANTYETQFFFQIADLAPSKALKANETVNLKFKIKALATETVPAATELSLGGGFHKSNDGAGWLAGATASKIKVGEWTTIEQKFEIDNPSITSYSIDLSQDDKGSITYLIDEVEGTWTEAPVLDWVELIPNGDCETVAEHAFAAAKEVPVDGSNVNKARIVDGVGKDGGKGIEVVAGAKESQAWDNQFWIYEPYYLPAGTSIVVEFDYKADLAGSVGTQSHREPAAGNNYLHYIGIGNVSFTTEWQHFKYEGKIQNECDGKDDADNPVARFLSFAFNLNDIADANKYYFDNLSFKVPADVISGKEPIYDVDTYKEVEYVDPKTLDWTDNILKNGDLKGDDMSEFYLKNNDVEDPETLPVEKTEFKGAFEIDIETAARPAGETEGSVGGNDHDAQFFVRLPYVLPKGKTFNLEFDLYAEEINTLAIQAHGEPGQYKANLASVKTDPSVDAVHFQKYLKAPADMRSIAINLAVATDATYAFSNFKVQIVKDDEAEIKAATEAADATTLWAETLALNEAAFEGRNTETEGKGYDEALVKALEDAIAAGKAELKKEDATKESLAAAAKAIEDAIAALTGGEEELLPAPETDPDYADFEEIAQDQGASLDSNPRATFTAGEKYNTYSATEDLTVAFKMYDIDVKDCDYVTVKFATPAPKGWVIAFGKHDDLSTEEIPEGATEFKKELQNVASIEDDILPQITILTLWGAEKPLNMKVYGVYKHKSVADAIAEVEEGAVIADGKYIENGQIVIVKGGKKYTAAGVEIK